MEPSNPRNHEGQETAAQRLRRQFERDDVPPHQFGDAKIPAYPQFVESRLSPELREKLAYRRSLGYANPRALTPSQRRTCDLERSARSSREIDNLNRKSQNPTAFEKKLASENSDSMHQERVAAETYRYGGPLLVKANKGSSNIATGLFLIFGACAAFGGTSGLLEGIGGQGWSLFGWSALCLLIAGLSFIGIMVLDTTRKSDLTVEDCAEIDQACEIITLRPDQSKEYRLVAYAASLTRRIRKSPSWSSKFLETQRIRLDCKEELRQIILHAFELRSLRTHLGHDLTSHSPASVRARDHINKATAPFDAAWTSLIDRVEALESLALHVCELDEQLAVMEKVQRVNEIENKFGALFASAVSDEFAAEHTWSITKDSAYIGVSIDVTLDALRGDIAGLTELAANLPNYHRPTRGDDRLGD
ncbi:hypothetical protein [Rhodococcus sp. ARC_M6]|uniref:hypothetical protein n=1 Tax=Rhodococcus sp. ARC_M6 TaxID=2928852 RepID=UPI001FB27F2A|nr:hypothetical protein [Rhodococcus sp. ARC_M6]MCJ0907467.1 hypothetical protein [Rhodococcus sp. ARC_M6]